MLQSRSAALNKDALQHWFGCVVFFLTGGGPALGGVGGVAGAQVLGPLVSCSLCLLLSSHDPASKSGKEKAGESRLLGLPWLSGEQTAPLCITCITSVRSAPKE